MSPTFLVHAADDKSVSVENTINYFLALKKHQVPAEMHIYEKGGHAFGLGRGDTNQYWIKACENWLRSSHFLE